MPIQWTADLAVGIETIDNQHRRLFEIVDGLLEAMQSGKGRQEVSTVVDFLGQYVHDHFSLEERVMREIGDPSYRVHKAEHEAFVRTFEGLRQAFQDRGASSALVIEINHRVCGWLRNHIARTDMGLAETIAAHGSAPLALVS